jgi:hypothetical protein
MDATGISPRRSISSTKTGKTFFNPLITRRELVACYDFTRFPVYNHREEAIENLFRRLAIPFLGMASLVVLIGTLGFFFYHRFRVV